MTREQWRRIDEMFGRAIELDRSLRAAFVIAAAGDDHELRAQVLSLLANDDGARHRMRAIVDGPELDP